jgi:hypothetical protein
MKGVHLFFVTFPAILPINYTTSSLATYLEVVLGSSKYHHQDGGIPNTGIKLVLLDNGSMVNEMDPSMFYNLSWQFDLELHYFKFGITQKRHYEIQDIITRVVAFHTQKLRQSSCIMAQGQMEGIHLFFIIFPDILPINCTTLKMKQYGLLSSVWYFLLYFDSLGEQGHN